MKRCIGALAASIVLALGAGVSVASANGLPTTPSAPLGQTNESDQGQIQIVPVAPQVNVQNANVATHGDVEQGDANNANTGQASQQENTQGGSQAPVAAPAQTNDSDQAQIQVVPIAPQVNVQNVNVATHGDVEQGDVNNANTGQANQQENTASAGGSTHPSPTCGSCSGKSSGPAQTNDSDQSQIQIVPIAPQVNVQNVNVATHGDVEQGDANNANTGQASQQENTAKSSPSKCGSCSSKSSGTSGSRQKNDSDQSQIQIVPIAPQVNVQNVNVATFGDVEQGDANNANTGQANQQSNSAKSSPSKCGSCSSTSSDTWQKNDSDQSQIQVVPIAPQLNVQNANVFTFGDVEQGDANNANTGQASQQENTSKAGASRCGSCSRKSPGTRQTNDSDQRQIQIVPIAPQLNVQNANVFTFGDVEQGDANNANTGQANQQENISRSGASRCGSCTWNSSGTWQKNDSDQRQIQIVPIAPQLNVQNANVFTFGDVEQGDANNANTGQANQQSNTARGSSWKWTHCGCKPKPEPAPCRCEPKPEPKPCGCQPAPKPEPKPCDCHPKPEPKPCGCKPAPRPEPKPCECKPAPRPEPKPCECKRPEPPKRCHCKPSPHHCGCAKPSGGQTNRSRQKQIQFIPIAPQLNVQNVNVLTFGDVRQGNANNANTGQANQQSNSVLADKRRKEVPEREPIPMV